MSGSIAGLWALMSFDFVMRIQALTLKSRIV
jgi:hypothetical protein